MKMLFTNIVDYILAIFHRITRNQAGMMLDCQKQENKILRRLLIKQGINPDEVLQKARTGSDDTSTKKQTP